MKMISELLMLLVVVLTIGDIADSQTLIERNGIINATLLQNMSKFPHHVSIYVRPYENTSPSYYCSGSILTSRWILTVTACVGWNTNANFTLMFNRLNANINAPIETQSYSRQVGQEQIRRHEHANLALIHLSEPLEMSNHVAAIALVSVDANFAGQRAIMSGVKQNTKQMSYGEFEIISDEQCLDVYPWYDRVRGLCTLGWHNSSTVPCANTQGGGLLIDWPDTSRLVGVFSTPQSCLSYTPAEYVRISFYLSWIEQVLEQRIQSNGYFN